MNREFWKGKKVLVTGHTGFKGSWLSLWLQRLGSEVTGFALPPPTTPSLFVDAEVSRGMNSVTGDIRDYSKVETVVFDTVPEIVLHMAAQTVIRHSYEDPVETFGTNVIGTVNLLEAVRRSGRSCVVVNVTTDKCYENREWVWGYRETDPLGGRDPYSCSKACSELVTAAFRSSFFQNDNNSKKAIAVASARAGNVIGGGDWTPYQLIPDAIRAFLNCKPVSIRSPEAIRPWQFVLEPLAGYLTLAERLWSREKEFMSAWNFGPRDEDVVPVSWIVTNLVKLWGEGAGWMTEERKAFHEAGYLKLDSSKSRHRLGWNPVVGLSDGLEWVVEWYKGYQQGSNIRDVTYGQIDRYENLLFRGEVTPVSTGHSCC